MRVAVALEPRLAELLRAFFPEVDEISVEDVDLVALSRTHTGVVMPLTSRMDVRSQIDMFDGLAKVVGAVDTVMFQSTGAGVMVIGFTIASNSLARAIRRDLDGRSVTSTIIVGGTELASAAIATSIELGAKDITLITDTMGGPGAAVSAAHRMGVDVGHSKVSEGHERQADLVIVTDASEFAQLVDRGWSADDGCHVACAVPFVSDNSSNTPFSEFSIERMTDHIRLLTGVNPDRDRVAEAVESANGAR